MAISRRGFLKAATVAAGAAAAGGQRAGAQAAGNTGAGAAPVVAATGPEDRAYWVNVTERLARPVLGALRADRLDAVLRSRKDARADRMAFAPLEALGRLLAGIGPWLESGAQDGAEGKARAELAQWAREGIARAVDPASPSYMNFNRSSQPLVDAAFLAHGMLRAKTELWGKLDAGVRKNVVAALKLTRAIKASQSNWLLFSAMVEALIGHAEEADGGGAAAVSAGAVETALAKHEEWYKGDGAYGDGPTFHFDYYNSFVIHPMLIDVLETLGGMRPEWGKRKVAELKRAARYAAVQERMISPEGTWPPIGRSLVYRFGAFQLLSQVALRKELPAGLKPAQVRGALTAAIRRVMEFPGTFDGDGMLTLGVAGSQPSLAETYISPGSPYLCATGLLALGLPAADAFWSDAPAAWTSRQVFGGEAAAIDHALAE